MGRVFWVHCSEIGLATSTGFDLISHSAEQTAQIGVRLGQLLAAGDLICLSGGLGAGKTALAAGIGKGWGALEPINSPTFVLVHEHHRSRDGQCLYHLDCYRLNSLDDAESAGIEDILAADDSVMIEWPEQIADLLPPERLWITLELPDAPEENVATERHIIIRATGERYMMLLEQLKTSLYVAGN
jgi:tRNA threonylcarbamoyladenosine biosynthesis protein TsaE